MTFIRIYSYILCFIVLFCGLMINAAQGGDIEDISIINLIATPDKYHGKSVRVIGYSSIKQEETAIYISTEDAKNNITKNAIFILFKGQETNSPRKGEFKYYRLNKMHVIVEGVFDKNQLGHGGLYSGTIKEITRFERW